MLWHCLFLIQVFTVLFSLLVGRRVTDATGGYQAYRLKILDDPRVVIHQPWLGRYEVEAYIFAKTLLCGYRWKVIPVRITYTERGPYTRARPVLDWWGYFRPVLLVRVGLKGSRRAGPAASSWGNNCLDVFVRGIDYTLYHMVWAGAWYGWESLGGALNSDPTAVSSGYNRIDVFARGADNGLNHKVWYGTGWSAWESLGGALAGSAHAASWGLNRLDVFARGTDNGLIHHACLGYAWTGWETSGGTWTSDPSAVSWATGRIDIFTQGTDTALWHFGFQS